MEIDFVCIYLIYSFGNCRRTSANLSVPPKPVAANNTPVNRPVHPKGAHLVTNANPIGAFMNRVGSIA